MNEVKQLELELTGGTARGKLFAMLTPPNIRSVDQIAARLRQTRLALGLTQAELSDRAGIGRNTYNQWEKAKGRPELDKALQLCDAFGLTLDWIYRGDSASLPHDLATRIFRAAS